MTSDEIKNLVRLANKQFDVELASEGIELGSKIWTLSWAKGHAKIDINGMTGEMPIFELSDLDGFEFSLSKKNDEPRDRLASTILAISGYRFPRSAYSSSFTEQVLKSIESLNSETTLQRIHRIHLRNIFGNALKGTSITFKDVSNLYMIIEAFIRR